MMLLAVILLLVTNVITLTIMLRARYLNQQIHKNQQILRNWLKVHKDLQNASGTVVEIRRMDLDSIFYKEPS